MLNTVIIFIATIMCEICVRLPLRCRHKAKRPFSDSTCHETTFTAYCHFSDMLTFEKLEVGKTF